MKLTSLAWQLGSARSLSECSADDSEIDRKGQRMMVIGGMLLMILLCDRWTGAEVLARARFTVDIPDGWAPSEVVICHGEPRGDSLDLQRLDGQLPRIGVAVAARSAATPSLDAIVAHDDQAQLKSAPARPRRALAPLVTSMGRRVLVRVEAGRYHRATAYVDDGPRVVYIALDGDSATMVDAWLSEFMQVVRSYRARE
jgi:hypothetical protein